MDCGKCEWRGNKRACAACKKDCDSPSVSATNVERAVCHAPVEKKKSARLDTYFNRKVNILVHSRRLRLCDADGISAKAVIDGLVHCGILENDSPEFVESVSYSQEKSKVEETIITIEEIE